MIRSAGLRVESGTCQKKDREADCREPSERIFFPPLFKGTGGGFQKRCRGRQVSFHHLTHYISTYIDSLVVDIFICIPTYTAQKTNANALYWPDLALSLLPLKHSPSLPYPQNRQQFTRLMGNWQPSSFASPPTRPLDSPCPLLFPSLSSLYPSIYDPPLSLALFLSTLIPHFPNRSFQRVLTLLALHSLLCYSALLIHIIMIIIIK